MMSLTGRSEHATSAPQVSDGAGSRRVGPDMGMRGQGHLALGVVAVALATTLCCPAVASGARVAMAKEARSISLTQAVAGRRGCGSGCEWSTPVISTKNRRYAYVSLGVLNSTDGSLAYSVRFLLKRPCRRCSSWRVVFTTGGGASPCRPLRAVPKRVRRELGYRCSRGYGAGFGPRRVKSPSRFLGEGFTDGNAGKGRVRSSFGRATIAAANKRFGTPKSIISDGAACRLSWPEKAVSAVAISPTRSVPCRPGDDLISLRTEGPGWYTSRGLKVGSPASLVRRLYPAATRYLTDAITTRSGEPRASALFGGLQLTQLRNGLFIDAESRGGKVVALVLTNSVAD